MQARYGISTCITFGQSRGELFPAMAQAGFRYVELAADRGHLGGWATDPAATRRELDELGMQALSVHSAEAGWKNNAADEDARRASVDAAADCFEAAREVGARVVIIHPTSGDFSYTEGNFQENRRRAVCSLTELTDRAAKAGICLAVENMPARERLRPGVRVADLLDMISGLGDHVGICVDAGHANVSGLDPGAEARAAGNRLLAVHIHDNDGSGADSHLMPGKGTTDLTGFIEALDAAGFSGGRMLEVPLPRETLRQTLSSLAAWVNRRQGRESGSFVNG